MPVLPFKLNQDRRRHIPEQKRKVVNWREYDESLRRRGSLTVWFSDEAIEAWKASPRTGRGDDATQVGPLLDQVAEPVASVTADGAFDQDRVYADVAERHPDADVIVPPRSTAVPSATAKTVPTQRDRHLQLIAEKGRMGWQKATGYNARARAEAAISRYKRVIGDGLHSRTDRRRATEVNVGVHALNRMLELGRPESIRIA